MVSQHVRGLGDDLMKNRVTPATGVFSLEASNAGAERRTTVRVLLSGIGTRGDVQPIVALAVELRERGHDVRLCVPPNFLDWVGGFGFDATPIGIAMREPRGGSAGTVPTPEQMREMVRHLVTNQFDVIASAMEGCELIVGGGAHQYAVRSIAESRGIPSVVALYAPVVLPSPDHAPGGEPGGDPVANMQRWADESRAWDQRFLELVNDNRRRLGLAPLSDVLNHVLSDEPWLAADPTLGPLPSTPGMRVVQTGAWILADEEPLEPALEEFVAAGAPPVYVGFGSMPADQAAGRTVVEAVRSVGRRVVLSRGWAELSLSDDADDVIAIGDVNQQALFPRVAAVVHHGGAGTTTTAARAGVPQVLVPMFSDQPYWGSRVRALGLGASVPRAELSVDSVASALRVALEPRVANRAAALAGDVKGDGAAVAARLLEREYA
ncbi:glycosyltransferase [Archangium violaceum]|uniref:glycosyltransferase n=1 Tax=Archangium violaceum TaxID=83451 RepID=UPI001EF6EC9A|nr:glycosyltransferase [Archangium violaceum]